MDDLIPTHGVRVLLDRTAIDERGATYRVEIHAPSASWRAEVRLEGTPAIGAWQPIRGEQGAEPEPWMIESARGFLRTLIKNHAAEGDWPARQLRWRERR